MCSTPFGITEVGIWLARFGFPGSLEVLHAFRHHRGGHTNSYVTAARSVRCSTPFGITEVGIRLASRTSLSVISAQRLSASQRWASGDLTDERDNSDAS